jgi:hypothetical protein
MNEEVTQCRPSGNPEKKRAGIGMPATLYLQEFGKIAYHVGSSLTSETWRDVDVRIMLDAEKYKAWGLGDPKNPHANCKWVALTMAFSELGRKMTGLPIDFQVQETEWANNEYRSDVKHQRSALHMVDYRRTVQQEEYRRQYPLPCSDCGEDSYVSEQGETLYLTNSRGKTVGPFCKVCADKVRHLL